jgi:hypothetical protein
MAFYLVKAKPKSNIADLRYDIAHGMIHTLIPFGKSLQYSLENARLDDDDYAVWIEEDYCIPPLAMEKETVLDRYFDNIKVEAVSSEEEGWNRIKDKRLFWKAERA